MGARLRWASLTMRTIWARSVSAPTRSARMTKPPAPLTVPPVTRLPWDLLDGDGLAGHHRFVHWHCALRARPRRPALFRPGAPAGGRLAGPGREAYPPRVPSSRRRRAVFGARPSRPDGAARLAPRAQFEDLPQEDERRDDRSRLKVHGHCTTVRAEGRREDVRARASQSHCRHRRCLCRWR